MEKWFECYVKPLGRPSITVRHSFISDIGKIISNVDSAGSFNSWAHIAFDESIWTDLVQDLESKQAESDDSDWKDQKTDHESSDWKISCPQSPPSSSSSFDHSSTPPFSPFSHDISHNFKIFGVAHTKI